MSSGASSTTRLCPGPVTPVVAGRRTKNIGFSPLLPVGQDTFSMIRRRLPTASAPPRKLGLAANGSVGVTVSPVLS